MSTLKDWLFRLPPNPPPYVIENLARWRPRRFATLFGIEWLASPFAWIAPIWILACGIGVAQLTGPGSAADGRLLLGLLDSVLIAASILLHNLGGAAAGALAGSPMRRVTFTSTLAFNAYDRSRTYSSRVHLIRSLAEPAANLMCGLAMFGLYRAGNHAQPVAFLAVLNLAFFVIAMAPLPTMHGGVVLKHLKDWTPGPL